MESESKVWSALSLAFALGAAALARKGLSAGWRVTTGKEPPANPADPDIALREAILWAVVSGTIVALVRMLATRRAANFYARTFTRG